MVKAVEIIKTFFEGLDTPFR